MKFTNNTRFFFFVTLIFWTLTLRSVYTSPHGADTWSHLFRAISITESGYVGWFIHPLSFFGWYSFSYPAGIHVFASAFFQVTDLEPNFAVNFFSYCLSIILIFQQYIFLRMFFRRDDSIFVGLFISSTICCFDGNLLRTSAG